MSRQDAADAMAYGICVQSDIMAGKTVDSLLDWDRLKANGVCQIPHEAMADLDPGAAKIFSLRINNLPFTTIIWRDDLSSTTNIQRVHYANAWTGRNPRKRAYSHCDGCGHIGQYLVIPAFCPRCRTPDPSVWPPHIFIKLMDLLSSLIIIKK